MNNNESRKYELTGLDEKDINLILTGLGQMPYIQSAGMINRITTSFNIQTAQLNKKEEKKEK